MINTREYLDRSQQESNEPRTSFGVSPLPRAKAKGTALQTAGAIFEQENLIASTLLDQAYKRDRFTDNDPNFNALEHVTPGHLAYASAYADNKNLDEVRDTYYKVERELANREMFARRPLESFFVGFIAGNLDPTILMPGTLFYKNWKAQYSTALRATGAGGAMGLQSSAQEYILHETQKTRTAEESAANMLAATMIGSAVGAYSGRFINSPNGRSAVDQTEQILNNGNISPPGVGPLPDGEPKPKKPSGGTQLEVVVPMEPEFQNALPEGIFHGTAKEIVPEKLRNIGEKAPFNTKEELVYGSVVETPYHRNDTPFTGSNSSIYGSGLYTTYKSKIAKAYTKKGAKYAKEAGRYAPTVYRINENKEIRLKDIDIDPEKDIELKGLMTNILSKQQPKWVEEVLEIPVRKNDKFTNFLDSLRRFGVKNKITIGEYQNFILYNVQYPLAEKGYRGLTHIGGVLTGREKHKVNIYWYARDDLNIYKVTEGGAGGIVPPADTSTSFDSPNGKSVGAQNVLEASMIGQGLKMAKAAAKVYNVTLAKLTPSSRMATNRLSTIRMAGEHIFENNWRYEKNYSIRDEYGQEKGFKPHFIALETRIKVAMGEANSVMMRIDDLYFEQSGIKKNEMLKLEKDYFYGEGMNREEFGLALFRDLIRGFVDENPQVSEAAKLMHGFFEKYKDLYTELGVFPEGMTVRNSVNYFTHYYNVPRIKDPRYRPESEEILTSWYRMVNDLVAENIDEIKAYKKELKKMEKEAKKDPSLKDSIDEFKQNFRERMPEEIFDAQWRPRSVIYDEDQIWVNVQNTLDNITNLNEGRFKNQYLTRMGIGSTPRPTSHRTLLIPTELLEPMLITDYRKIIPMFAHSMIPNYYITKFAQDMGFNEEEPDVSVAGAPGQVISGIMSMARNELDARLRGATEKEAFALHKAFEEGQQDIKAGLQLLMQIFGNDFNSHDTTFARFRQIAGLYNYTRMMGYMTISALPDMGTIVLRNGYGAMVHDGVKPIIEGLKAGGFNKDFMQLFGYACNKSLGVRLKSYIDQQDLIGSDTRLSKAFDYLATRMGNTNLFNQWTDLMQEITGNVVIGQFLRDTVGYKQNIDQLMTLQDEMDVLRRQDNIDYDSIQNLQNQIIELHKESLPDATRTKYLAMGIDDQHFEVLYKEWARVGGVEDGVYWLRLERMGYEF